MEVKLYFWFLYILVLLGCNVIKDHCTYSTRLVRNFLKTEDYQLFVKICFICIETFAQQDTEDKWWCIYILDPSHLKNLWKSYKRRLCLKVYFIRVERNKIKFLYFCISCMSILTYLKTLTYKLNAYVLLF